MSQGRYDGFSIEDIELAHLGPSERERSPLAPPGETELLPPARLAHQLESFAAATRSLESNLIKERGYSKQLREYIAKLNLQFQELQNVEARQRARLEELQKAEALSTTQAKNLGAELAKAREELNRYRKAWSEILNREQEARAIVADGTAIRKRIEEQEAQLRNLHQTYMTEKSKLEQSERHAHTYRSELQSALVRLHASEAKYNELSKELAALHLLRKNHQQEAAKLEQSLREKFEVELIRERDRLQAEAERQVQEYQGKVRDSEREKWKAESESAIRRELESAFHVERERLKADCAGKLEAEKARADAALSQLRQELEGARATSESEKDAAIAALVAEKDSAMAALSAEQARAQAELESHSTELAEIRQQLIQTQKSEQDERQRATAAELFQPEVKRQAERVAALKAECRLLREVLVAERQSFREDLTTLRALLAELESPLEPCIDEWLSCQTEVPMVSAGQVTTTIAAGLPPKRFNA